MNRYAVAFPATLVLTPLSRRPLKLPDETVQAVLERAVPVFAHQREATKVKRVSIVVVTFNKLVFTRLCLESLLANTAYPNYEIIIVDNASTDGTRAYLRRLESQDKRVRVKLNDHNLGFAPANNQGLSTATGEVLILLNNDTMVPGGWLSGLTRHLQDPSIGLVGPVTNRIGNEAEIEASYRTYGEFIAFARSYTQTHAGKTFAIRTLCMFCLALRRDVYERLGPLDERFAGGMLEDDDYAMRARAAGYRVVCAEDAFVHHFNKASFGSLIPTGEYGKMLAANRRRFEEKWGVPWQAYSRRLSRRYLQLAERLREAVRHHIPPDATVLVVSRGDEALLELEGRRAWHFPQSEDGGYAGCYPADSAEGITHLEALRAKGAGYLIFPEPAFWWLEHYREFKRHLLSKYQVIAHLADTCLIVVLREGGAHGESFSPR